MKTLEFPDGDLLRFDGVCLAICNSCFLLTFGTYSLCLVLSFSALWCCWFVVGLFGRVLFVTGCFKGFGCPPVFFVGWGFLVGVESRILEWVHWWYEVF